MSSLSLNYEDNGFLSIRLGGDVYNLDAKYYTEYDRISNIEVKIVNACKARIINRDTDVCNIFMELNTDSMYLSFQNNMIQSSIISITYIKNNKSHIRVYYSSIDNEYKRNNITYHMINAELKRQTRLNIFNKTYDAYIDICQRYLIIFDVDCKIVKFNSNIYNQELICGPYNLSSYKYECKQVLNTAQFPWFDWIYEGSKTYEGRLYKGLWSNLKLGDEIILKSGNKSKCWHNCMLIQVKDIKYYKDFGLAFDDLGDKLVPIKVDRKTVMEEYQKFHTEYDLSKYLVICIGIEIIRRFKI